MDLATLIGIVGAFGVVGYAISMGGSFSIFVDVPSLLIVFGGGIAATIIRFSLGGVVSATVVGSAAAFGGKAGDPRDLIEEIAGIADVMRRQGPLGLEKVETDDKLIALGVRMIADGYETAHVTETLQKERDLTIERLDEGARVYKAFGDSGPAFGMIGTLVGLVQMLQAMDDPSKIGPAMAVALLTTLYGALISNVVCLPINEKLKAKSKVMDVNMALIVDGITQIREGRNPGFIRDSLKVYLPHKQREADMAEAA